MKNSYSFNNIIYKGNINRDFYLYCCFQNKWLFLYIFKHIFFYVLSLVSIKAESYYKKTYFSFLKRVKDVDKLVNNFVEKNKNKISKLYLDNYDKNNLVIAKSPEFLVKSFLKEEKILAFNLKDDYTLDFTEYFNKLEKVDIKYDKYFCNSFKDINLVNSEYKFIKKGNIFINYKNNKFKKVLYYILKYLIPVVLAVILLFMTFQFTTVYLDKIMISKYLNESKLLLLNILPILLLIYILLFLTKRLWLSFSVTSLLVILIGIINKTKLYYRDDVFKFEDITLFKEALLMTERYEIIIRWYTIVSILACLIIVMLLKKNYSKLKMKNYVSVPISLLLIIFSVFIYKEKYISSEVYNSVGNTSNINIWIGTRQSQIRGLIYPFIYSSTEVLNNEPVDYNEDEVKKVLKKYTYENIPNDKKVNIIAIMLEAYNDFSKFDSIEFTDDVYEKFHKIEKNSLSGNIIVDIFGGGTIQTERRFLTGYYNFPTFRKETNSYARYFKEQGYQVYVYHPMYGAFYNRNTGNYNMGFDTYWNYENRFSSYSGWSGFASDSELYSELIKDYENNKDKNKFYFAVTYQNHGPYSSCEPSETYIKNNGYSEAGYNILNNYLSGIKETNDTLYDLVKYIDSSDEPTILIFFGDHNPYLGEGNLSYVDSGVNIDLETEDGFENYYSIPYVIHANNGAKEMYGKSFKGKLETISPNYIMNELFEYIGLKGNEYLQYTSDVKKEVSVINDIYYMENGKYISKKNSEKQEVINEFLKVNYYWSKSK